MTKIISSSRFSFPRRNMELADFSSTILIPEKYFSIFNEKIILHKGVRSYIHYLLNKYQIYITNGLIPGYSNITTKYQEKGQNLHKISFRPKPENWAELKLYRISFGMSISAFIVYLLIADSVDLAETFSDYLEGVGILSIPKFDLIAKVYLFDNATYYTTIFQFHRGKYY
ncbi:MAG TPA: DUF1564 family protein [Leptospiraceae bacterium]|nr:DUF1564 family protein [Leptospiraceae bacterium]HMW04464.1 DUF1564 family protein [Leptospiraceae bacterium]HMX31122.1 DUF1564 family protein [Leptospiraceae bacterium]HMY30650.1 DUF1564 family protein [Leptospiraceae bacterium]HMZ65817.1 DUF1564 family protein [Leptospiraceae bacterium]